MEGVVGGIHQIKFHMMHGCISIITQHAAFLLLLII